MSLLIESAAQLGLEITPAMQSQFVQYKQLMIDYNKRINLTAILDEKEIVLKHFIDSVSVHGFIKDGMSVIDVGTGAGLPGIPIKIVNPQANVTLLDSLNKRIIFLNEVIKTLELENISAIHGRAEDVAKESNFRENFDIATSRAVAQLYTLAEYCLPFVKVGGKFLAFKGQNIEDELESAKDIIDILGARVSEVKYIKIPFTDIKHSIIVIDKINQTPAKYPRKPNKIKKSPIKL